MKGSLNAAGIGAFELLQIPVEGVVARLLPFVDVAGDLTMDGAEAIIGLVLIATLLLPPPSLPPPKKARSPATSECRTP